MQLRLQYAVLFAQEFDEIVLFPFDPAEQRGNDQVQRQHAEVYAKPQWMEFSDISASSKG